MDNGKIPDAIDIKNGIIRELKPDNARKIKEGVKQVKNYINQLRKQYKGKKWKYAVDTYTENPDGTFNYKYGNLNNYP